MKDDHFDVARTRNVQKMPHVAMFVSAKFTETEQLKNFACILFGKYKLIFPKICFF